MAALDAPHPYMRTRTLVAAALAAASPALAQNLSLDRIGGALGGTVSFPVHGEPNEPYVVLMDLVEQTTTIPSLGITLDISDQFAWFSFNAPTFAGTTDGNGNATAAIVFPNDVSLEPCVFSLQAVAGLGPWRVSNLVRLTPQVPGTFKPTLTEPQVPIAAGGAVAGADGGILFVGGSGPVAQRYRSRTEEWELAGTSFGVGLLSQTTGLADGRVLFTGGLDLATGQPTAAAAIFDPATQSTTTLTMSTARAGHAASLLGNGKVLVTGGLATFDLTNPLGTLTGILGSTELFDPATNTFGPGPGLLEPRAFHTSTTLTSGEALIAGGLALLPIVNIPNVSSTAYRFNPATNSFGLPAIFSGGRFLHSATALDNGRVLLAGGLSLDLTVFLQTGNIQDLIVGTRSDCQVFQPGILGFGSFTTVNGMQQGRAGAAVARLPNGGALVAGGFQLQLDLSTQTFALNLLDTADVLTANPYVLAPTGSMAAARLFPFAMNLSDGTVLIVGGGAGSEVYQR